MRMYRDYLSESIDKRNQKVLFVISQGLRKLLERVYKNYEDPIAQDMLRLHKRVTNTISFLDRSREIDQITYSDANRIIDELEDKGIDPKSEEVYNYRPAWIENRRPIKKIGRIINRILEDRDYSPRQIENFVNRFKSESKKDTSGLKWDRVHGRDINNWYLADRYVKGGGTLNRSCLRKSDRNAFVNFLSGNPNTCRLLTLQNDQGQLLGRALMWRLTEPEGRIFMDRVYTRFDEDVNLFIESAKHMGWLYKSKQTYGGEIPLIDGKTGEETWIKMVNKDFKKRNFVGYPYMDTFQYYDVKNNLLTNDPSTFVKNGNVVKLNRIDGTYTTYEQGDDDQGDMLDI